jgi:hypothetical protein
VGGLLISHLLQFIIHTPIPFATFLFVPTVKEKRRGKLTLSHILYLEEENAGDCLRTFSSYICGIACWRDRCVVCIGISAVFGW